MPEKPSTADGYRSEQIDLVRATCLYVATKLGDLMDDLVVIGGLVPSLLIDPEELARGTTPHVGTMDLDVGLAVALLDQGRYRTITERLRRAGFSQDVNAEGHPTRQRGKIEGVGRVTVDFLIPPTQPGDVGGTSWITTASARGALRSFWRAGQTTPFRRTWSDSSAGFSIAAVDDSSRPMLAAWGPGVVGLNSLLSHKT